MIERLAALFRGVYEDLERFFDAFLADVLCQPART